MCITSDFTETVYDKKVSGYLSSNFMDSNELPSKDIC